MSTAVFVAVLGAFVAGLIGGGVFVAAVYERRNADDEELPERTDREPFTGHVPVSPWAAPKDDDEGRP